MKNQQKLRSIIAALLIGCFATGVNALDVFQVDAVENSVSGGVGLDTGILVTKGQLLTINANTADRWSIDPDPIYLCNANGEGNPFGKEQKPTTIPNIDFSFLNGTLIGSLDDGKTFFPIGIHSEQTIISDGALKLYMWDTDNTNNSGKITVDVAVYNRN